jgi:DNA-binding transcriptional ArsR family regulator
MILEDSHAERAAALLLSFSVARRLQMLEALINTEMSVGEISQMVKLPQNVTSVYLLRMHNTGILERRRQSRHVFYQVRDDMKAVVKRVIAAAYAHTVDHKS